MRTTIQNKSSVIIGFDADLTDCGIAVYSVPENKVFATYKLSPYPAIGEMIRLSEQYNNAIFRIETPDQRSAYGAGKMKGQRGAHSVAFSSGESSGVAKILIQELSAKGAYIETVAGSSRYNLTRTHRNTAAVNSLPLAAQVSWVKRHRMSKIPSKGSADLALSIFPSLGDCKYNNDAVRDALFLALPERLYFFK